jgi:hypothetical protein
VREREREKERERGRVKGSKGSFILENLNLFFSFIAVSIKALKDGEIFL